MTRLFVLHDDPTKRWCGSVEVSEERARELNKEGYGVFHTVNEFAGRRLQANLTKINYYFCEIDNGVQRTLTNWMAAMPLKPTWVVQSKRGYHAYWAAKDATPANWKRIVRHGIVPALGGDPAATDVLRLLRAPGFYHMKDSKEPFLVQTVWESDLSYTEAQMLEAYPDKRKPRCPTASKPAQEGDFWWRANQLDARDALIRLSGHWLVKGERFWLVEQSNGNANVYVQTLGGELVSTKAFVTPEGKLFADQVGIPAWVHWYQKDYGTVAIGLRQLFPELED